MGHQEAMKTKMNQGLCVIMRTNVHMEGEGNSRQV